MPWTIDLWIDHCSYSRVTKVSINWNCPGKWCQRLSSSWNCLGNSFRRLLIGFARRVVLRDCLLIGIVWSIDVWYFLTIGAVRSNDFGVYQLELTELWWFQSIGIVQTNDLGHCLSFGIVLKIVFTMCLLIGLDWTIDIWCFQLIGIVQTNDLGRLLLIEIVPIFFSQAVY